MTATTLRRRKARAYGVQAGPPVPPPGYYALVFLGAASVAIDHYHPDGSYGSRMATLAVPGMRSHGDNDSALVVPRDPAAIVGDETAIFTGERTDMWEDIFPPFEGFKYGVWSWNWRAGAVTEFIRNYTGHGYFRPQLQHVDGYLYLFALLDRPAGAGNDRLWGQRGRLDLADLTDQATGIFFAILDGGLDNAPFGLGDGWISHTSFRYRYLGHVETEPEVEVFRWPIENPPGGFSPDPGWALAQGCADPAGGDSSLGGRVDLAGGVLHRATGESSIAEVWSDPVPAAAVRPLAATVDTAGGVMVPYLLTDHTVRTFHGDPDAGAAATVRTLVPQGVATFLAVSVRP